MGQTTEQPAEPPTAQFLFPPRERVLEEEEEPPSLGERLKKWLPLAREAPPMWEELKNNRAVLALVCLGACLLLGLGAARYLAPEQWASQTMAGASATGLLLGFLVYRRRPPTLTASRP